MMSLVAGAPAVPSTNSTAQRGSARGAMGNDFVCRLLGLVVNTADSCRVLCCELDKMYGQAECGPGGQTLQTPALHELNLVPSNSFLTLTLYM